MPGSLTDAFADFASAREVLRIVGCDPADAGAAATSDVDGEQASRAARCRLAVRRGYAGRGTSDEDETAETAKRAE